MAVEAFVFCGDDRVFENRGHAFRANRAAKLIATPGKDQAVTVQKRHRAARAPVHQIGDGGQRGVGIGDSGANEQGADRGDAP